MTSRSDEDVLRGLLRQVDRGTKDRLDRLIRSGARSGLEFDEVCHALLDELAEIRGLQTEDAE